ncbi:ankyrin [Neofusicoccum parvum]|nr:ankyrin [Neofusicoccum parvum]
MLDGNDLIKDPSKFSIQLREERWPEMDPHDRKSVDFLFVNAARGGHAETLQHMLDRYAYPRTALHDAIDEAITHGSTATVRLLLDRFPDIVGLDSCSSHGGTALTAALRIEARAAARAITELLLQRGADPNKRSASGLPMEYALTASWPELAPLLVKYGAEPFSLEEELRLLPRAAHQGRLEAVSRLVERGADVGTDCLAAPFKGTPLLNAVLAGHVDVAEYLLRAGADPNQRTGFDGKTVLQVALAHAARMNREDIGKVLRVHGARESP